MRRLLIAVCSLFVVTAFAQGSPPNVVLIVADDLGYADLGVTGSDYHVTPHLDALAAESVRFTRAYTNAPNCAPTRAALMSGMYAPRTGIYTVGNPDRGRSRDRKLIPTPNETVLRDDIVTLAEALRGGGYRTGIFGKWHLGDDPRTQGFETAFISGMRGHPKSYFGPFEDLSGSTRDDYLDDTLTDAAIKFAAEGDSPFFLYLPHYTVHTPIQPEPARLAAAEARLPGERHSRPNYAAMVESLDANVGRLLDTLQQHGLEENTVVVFISDNGGAEGWTTMTPMRGAKGQLYEGGLRTPMFVRWPARFEPRDVTEPALTFDLYPTLIELSGVKLPEQPMDAHSLVPLLNGGDALAEPREALYFHFPAYLQRGDRDRPFRTTPAGAIVTPSGLKLIEYFEDGSVELFDLAQDASETINLAADRPEVASRLRNQLAQWRAELNAPVPTQPNPKYRPRESETTEEELSE